MAIVPESLAGVRLDRAVSMLTGVSRSVAALLVAEGQVSVDGEVAGARSTAVDAGAELCVHLPTAEDLLRPDPDVPFLVVYEDEDLVVVDKPAGVVVHPGAGTVGGTLVAGLLARYPDLAGLGSVSDPLRPGIVHRLDKGTSGLLVVARSPAAYRGLVAQMGERTVGRRYLALVAGHLADDRGVVDAPIGRSIRSPTRMAVTTSGRSARTRYEVVERVERVHVAGSGGAWQPLSASLLSCTLETGRTHQIRVHLSAIGHPVVGDDRYGKVEAPRLLMPGRVFLHATELAIDHPTSGGRLAWMSPLPPDLNVLIEGATAS